MIIGRRNNILQKIPVKLGCQGYYLRWWYNGWHYWFFLPGDHTINTEGERYFTLSTRTITMSSGQVTRSQAAAIRTIFFTKEVYLLGIAGWMETRIDPGTPEIYNNMVAGTEIIITAHIGSREISYTTGFTPVPDIPIVPPENPVLCEIAICNQVWACYNVDINYPGSKVYNNDETNRSVFGGLYNWTQIMASGFCPTGWHIPTMAEWDELFNCACSIAELMDEPIYGLLYNWYAATDPRNIAAADWHVATNSDFSALSLFIDPAAIYNNNIVGRELKEIGITYWEIAGGLNNYGFNLKGNGHRVYSNGTFSTITKDGHLWHQNSANTNDAYFSMAHDINDIFETYITNGAYIDKNDGKGIRLVKDSTTLTHGQTGTYTGNDGKTYRTICIGTQEWLADNLCETKYRNGDNIPEVSDNAAWAALATGALCAYDNDWDNAYTIATDCDAGGILKSMDSDHWNAPNTEATDLLNFNARGSGAAVKNIFTKLIDYLHLKNYGYYWTADEDDPPWTALSAKCVRFAYDSGAVVKTSGNKLTNYLSVRLIKDEAAAPCVSNPWGSDPVDGTTVSFDPIAPVPQDLTINASKAWTIAVTHPDIIPSKTAGSCTETITFTVSPGGVSIPLGDLVISCAGEADITIHIERAF